MTLHYTKHAVVRCQQRGIPTQVVDVLYKHGSKVRSHNSYLYHFSKKDILNLQIIEPVFFKKYNKHLANTTIVCDDNTVITAMKNLQRGKLSYEHRDNRCIKDRHIRSLKRNNYFK